MREQDLNNLEKIIEYKINEAIRSLIHNGIPEDGDYWQEKDEYDKSKQELLKESK